MITRFHRNVKNIFIKTLFLHYKRYKNSVYDVIIKVQIPFWRLNMHDRSCMGEDLNQLTHRLGKILQVIGGYTVVSSTPITEVLYKEAPYKSGNEMPDVSDFVPFSLTDTWGGKRDSHAWFYFKHNFEKTPYRTELKIDTSKDNLGEANPQFMLYINSTIKQGIDANHRSAVINESGEADIFIYAYSGTDFDDPLDLRVSVQLIDEETEGLYYDLLIPHQILNYLPQGSSDYYEILTPVNEAINLLDLRDLGSENFKKSVTEARSYLNENLYSKTAQTSIGNVSCFGHTHIDLGWLWPVRQTVEKAQRSFATVMSLMERYPEYTFMSSQVPLYKWVKKEDPELYSRIKEKVAEGRWEPEGGMYCEADCNLAGGEGLVRQFLYGKRFFKDEFGVDSKVLWLPDVFGYSAALPQILLKCGIQDFVTSKISWNESNTIPNDLFKWKGIDGSEVMTHFMTMQNAYNGSASLPRYTTYGGVAGSVTMFKSAYERFTEKNITDKVMATIGWGDGGGGTTVCDCELMRRVNNGLPSLPKAKWHSVDSFITETRSAAEGNKYTSTWSGELYLEFHRKTYTSQAANKKSNRQSEFLLQNVETSAVIAGEIGNSSFDKPEHDKNWETVLLDQFHDILPGSSINEIYKQTAKDYAAISEYGNSAITADLNAISNKVADSGVLVFNPNGFAYSGAVEVDGKRVKVTNIPPKGYSVVTPASFTGEVTFDGKTLENSYYSVVFDTDMNISSIYDKSENRELLKDGKTVRFVAYEDFPREYDAWELSSYYVEKPYDVNDVTETSIVSEADRTGIKVVRSFGRSTITDTVWLYKESKLIEFDDSADWHEKHILLKREFPLDVVSDKAACEIQFGYAERPTHQNTSWDWAKFEVCAHKYVDLSDGGYGVALINDCKFGHGLRDGNISLSLLCGPTYPDPECDMGKHEFKYALLPHASSLAQSDVLKEAFFFNNPCIAIEANGGNGTAPASFSTVSTENERLVIDTVKPAEDGNGTVVRLYEGKRCQGYETLNFGIKANKVYLCDLLENELEEIEVIDNAVTLPFKPFEIITLKVK